MALRLPPPLQPGDRVRLAAASSCLSEGRRLQAGIEILQSWGLEVEQPFRTDRHWGYLAGHDHERLADFAPAPLLACVRGGWGAARLLEQGWSPPQGWLLGFSDVTSLLWAMQAAGCGGAIHGPLLTTLAGEPDWSRERLRRLLFGEPLPPLQGLPWHPGITEGPLLVANLTVATHLLGTRWCPPLQGAVLLLEDVGEAPYRIDRMLTHWRLAGALQQLAGLAFGSFEGCDPAADDDDARPGFGLEEVLRERVADLGIPVLADLPVGHGAVNAALPLGLRCRLDGDRGLLELLDGAAAGLPPVPDPGEPSP